MANNRITIRDICEIGILTALTVIMAQISIPMPLGVPMTMQTFAVMLAGVLLGSKKGFLAITAYVLLGAFGLPVFSGFRGGLGMLAGPTGGFILSFPIMALLAGLGMEYRRIKGLPAIALTAGTIFNFMCGMAVYSIATGNGLASAFSACVLPFVPTAVIKAAAAYMAGSRIKIAIARRA